MRISIINFILQVCSRQNIFLDSLRSHLVISIIYHACSHAGRTQKSMFFPLFASSLQRNMKFIISSPEKTSYITFMGIFGNRTNERICCKNKKLNNKKIQPNQTVKGNKIKVYLVCIGNNIHCMTYEK